MSHHIPNNWLTLSLSVFRPRIKALQYRKRFWNICWCLLKSFHFHSEVPEFASPQNKFFFSVIQQAGLSFIHSCIVRLYCTHCFLTGTLIKAYNRNLQPCLCFTKSSPETAPFTLFTWTFLEFTIFRKYFYPGQGGGGIFLCFLYQFDESYLINLICFSTFEVCQCHEIF